MAFCLVASCSLFDGAGQVGQLQELGRIDRGTYMTAHLVMQGADCPAYIDYVAIMGHEDLKGVAALGSVILLSGSAGEVRQHLLRLDFGEVPVVHASRAFVNTLSRFGVARTPALLITARNGGLTAAITLPATARGRLELGRILMSLAQLERSRGR